MKKLFEDSTNKEMLDEINEIDQSAIARISNIVKSLKRFVRLDEDIQQQADINQELDLTLDLLRHKTKNKVEIVKRYSKLPFVNCFPNMLNQVFLNILMNAIQAVENVDRQSKIRIKTVVRNKMLTVIIEDNGIGIDDICKERIFQAGYTTKKVGEGTGLGLAISKKIIEKHNGTISFKTRKNWGTTFVIKIPVF
jgi:signal transduction histidine kinase